MRRIYWMIALLMLSVVGLGLLTLPTAVGVRATSNSRAALHPTHNFYAAHSSRMANLRGPSQALIPAVQGATPGTSEKIGGKPREPRQGLSSLPAAAQTVVSATLGWNDARYQIRVIAQPRLAEVPRASCPCPSMAKMAMTQSEGALSAQNFAQRLQADFTRQGMEVRSGQTRWQLALSAYGYGDHLEKVRTAIPQSQANRVEYRRGPVVEWYVNGPAGLEQGFTLAEPPGQGGRDTGYGTRSTGHGARGAGQPTRLL